MVQSHLEQSKKRSQVFDNEFHCNELFQGIVALILICSVVHNARYPKNGVKPRTDSHSTYNTIENYLPSILSVKLEHF